MIVIRPVPESPSLDDFTLWPVGSGPSPPLGGELTSDQVGAVVARIACYNESTADESLADPVARMLSGLLTEDAFVVAGGLRVEDTATGVVLEPGCCNGLEEWRSWLDIEFGEEPWLGHDPTPGAELIGTTVRLHPDAGQPGPVIELPPADLLTLLAGVQRDLLAFLGLLANWADRYAPGSAEALVAAFDRALEITAAGTR
ncbi:hypothetical protein OHV05_26115 [Kitasatospora sp. NBC_00070]|uniref:hypothetical protein n=1 Tax=Kitasatospora sp. NBC_00070 TaxID=2975962 RepID=UPI0032544FC9